MKFLVPLCLLSLLQLALAAQTTTVTYQESVVDFPNPERGFYRYSSTYPEPYQFLDAGQLAAYRQSHRPSSAQYHIFSTLVFRYFFLDDFVGSPLSAQFLQNVQQDFDAVREAGVKLIVRFAYTETVNDEGCPSWICPPYGDAPKERVLEHIQQLKPLLQANKDVIAVVQLGFIGVWGEGYYTDYFGDASQAPNILTNENWQDRNEVLAALLDALPPERMVQVRYPQIKQRLVYGLGSPTSSPPLTLAEAYNYSNKARIGHHNDCFLASSTDFGTYNNYGPPTANSDTANLKPYLAEDSRFVAIGGETCNGYNPHDNCSSAGGKAEAEMERFHYSYLNSQYNNFEVNNDWVSQGCIENIKKRLGYRLVLQEGSYSTAARPGSAMQVDIQLKNVGYAAPFNPRDVELILSDNSQAIAFRARLEEVDPRFWEPGPVHRIQTNVCLPADMPPGNYELFLFLPDPEPGIRHRPEYAIHLANFEAWVPTLGFNRLNHALSVSDDAPANPCGSGPAFESTAFLNSLPATSPGTEWAIYPNPAAGEAIIERKGAAAGVARLLVLNALGQPVMPPLQIGMQESTAIDISGLPGGAYFFRMESRDGAATERVIVRP